MYGTAFISAYSFIFWWSRYISNWFSGEKSLPVVPCSPGCVCLCILSFWDIHPMTICFASADGVCDVYQVRPQVILICWHITLSHINMQSCFQYAKSWYDTYCDTIHAIWYKRYDTFPILGLLYLLMSEMSRMQCRYDFLKSIEHPLGCVENENLITMIHWNCR